MTWIYLPSMIHHLQLFAITCVVSKQEAFLSLKWCLWQHMQQPILKYGCCTSCDICPDIYIHHADKPKYSNTIDPLKEPRYAN